MVTGNSRAASTTRPGPLPFYAAGEWLRSSASEYLDVVNPATAEVLASVPLCPAADVAAAAEAAQAAFPAWRRTPPQDREIGRAHV
jgi:malonate-semialdehyde dehydrogenase (acetylating)/methylmalonate-semialdehyde dehydrogenase